MQENNDRFGIESVDDVQKQYKLYVWHPNYHHVHFYVLRPGHTGLDNKNENENV